jgi:hypothetical protein
LELNRTPASRELEIVGKALQSLEFRNSEASILPMKGTHVWTRLALDSRRGTIGVQLEKKSPVPRPPLEERLSVPFVSRVEEIVAAWWNRWQKVAVLPAHRFFRLW